MKLLLYGALLTGAGLGAARASDEPVVIENVKSEISEPAAGAEPDLSAWAGAGPDSGVIVLPAGGGNAGQGEVTTVDVPEVPVTESPVGDISLGEGDPIGPIIFQAGSGNPLPAEDPTSTPEPVAVPEREVAPELETPVKDEETAIEPEVPKALEVEKSSRKVQGFSMQRKMKKSPGAKAALKAGKRVFLA